MPTDERPTGDMPVGPPELVDDTRPRMADDVVATYIAAAVKSVAGVIQLHGKPWQEISERVHMGAPHKGVVVRETAPGVLDVEVHVSVAWGTVIPEMARTLQETVAHNIETLLDLHVARTTVYVDEVEAPPEFA
ncbi:MAG: Asp23/Gls24 family envelope stress response protein [Thermoleophilia bacterium]